MSSAEDHPDRTERRRLPRLRADAKHKRAFQHRSKRQTHHQHGGAQRETVAHPRSPLQTAHMKAWSDAVKGDVRTNLHPQVFWSKGFKFCGMAGGTTSHTLALQLSLQASLVSGNATGLFITYRSTAALYSGFYRLTGGWNGSF